jgi:flagellar FliL protein
MMKKNKTMTIVIIALVVVILIGVVITVALMMRGGDDKEKKETRIEPSIEDILLASVDVEEITTNLSDKKFVRLTLKIQTSSEEAAAELTQRDFQTKNILIKELSEMSSKDLEGKEGKLLLENTLKTQLNELMRIGEITEVSITSCIIS